MSGVHFVEEMRELQGEKDTPVKCLASIKIQSHSKHADRYEFGNLGK